MRRLYEVQRVADTHPLSALCSTCCVQFGALRRPVSPWLRRVFLSNREFI